MDFKGEGLKSFLASIVGGIFGSASKITGITVYTSSYSI
jgi:hypothetical protein